MTKIRILTKKPHEAAKIRWIDNTLGAFQQLVGGYIETVPLEGVSGALIVCNEEWKLLGLDPNFKNFGDYIAGPAAVVSTDGEEFASLGEDKMYRALITLALSDGEAVDNGGYQEEQSAKYEHDES